MFRSNTACPPAGGFPFSLPISDSPCSIAALGGGGLGFPISRCPDSFLDQSSAVSFCFPGLDCSPCLRLGGGFALLVSQKLVASSFLVFTICSPQCQAKNTFSHQKIFRRSAWGKILENPSSR